MPDQSPAPPMAPRRPTVLSHHGDERVDDWYWLRERDDPNVVAYLEAENAYTRAAMAHTEHLQQRLYEEMLARILETDLSPPAKKDDWWYYSRTVEGLQYAIHCRRHGGPEAEPEDVMLDENVLASGHDFFSLGAFDVSPDHELLLYSVDTNGSERYELRVRALATATDLPDVIPDTYYGTAWCNDNATFFYTRLDEAMRPHQVWRHRLGTPVDEDVLVFQEDDEHFFLSVDRTRSGDHVLLTLGSAITDEVWTIPADRPDAPFEVMIPRRHGVEYSVESQADRFLVTTNADGATNFKVVEWPSGRELIPYRPEVKIDGVDGFARHIAVYERREGMTRIRVMDADGDRTHDLEMPEPVYTVSPGTNLEYDTAVLRFGYTSLVTPRSVYDHDLADGTRVLVKQQPVLGGYDPADYVTDRLWATAADGARVPISIVHRRDRPGGPGPTVLYGYGSYGSTHTDPSFTSLRISLLDRGFVFAIAHIRGGGELGRPWYDDGKFLTKRNTFTDFVACAEHLIATGLTSPDQLAIRGGSAGGLLMGAVVNMRPDLFRAVVAEVPFVDCLTTILDPSLPLTVIEWEEWGNPQEREFYDYMKSYSPYENVSAQRYPAILVTAGLNDPRVSYWEPAKWVAKLRTTKTDDNRLLLKTEMGAGHAGPSGRYDTWKDEAFVYSFILEELGVEDSTGTPAR